MKRQIQFRMLFICKPLHEKCYKIIDKNRKNDSAKTKEQTTHLVIIKNQQNCVSQLSRRVQYH